ncbi:MAG: PqqD family protein [Oscillospiraceae bacterium]|nr:PqqD family protein [Oscillospiraceae bacterium]
MKVKEGFIIRKVAGKYVVVATGEASKSFHGMVKLNETAKTIWEGLADGKTPEEITEVLMKENNAETEEDRKKIYDDVQSMIGEMREAGFLVD